MPRQEAWSLGSETPLLPGPGCPLMTRNAAHNHLELEPVKSATRKHTRRSRYCESVRREMRERNMLRPVQTLHMGRIARPSSSYQSPWTTLGMHSPRPGAPTTGPVTSCSYLRERASASDGTQISVLLWYNRPKGVQLIGCMEQLTTSAVPWPEPTRQNSLGPDNC